MDRFLISRSKDSKDLEMPKYMTSGSVGMDLRANIKEDIVLKPMERKLIPTGIKIAMPSGYEAQIRPRSGLAIKNGITVLNTPGTIDSDYRGEINIILINLGNEDFIITRGERIAQMVINKVEIIEFIETDRLDDTSRGTGGFGHTGK